MQAAERIPLKLVYEGSVKRVFEPESAAGAGKLWFEFTDDYSVFDWGKMPDTIDQKGRALTVMGAWFFDTMAAPQRWANLEHSQHIQRFRSHPGVQELLQGPTFQSLKKEGLPSHFCRLVNGSGDTITLAQAAATPAELACMEVSQAAVCRPSATVILGQSIYYYPPVPESAKTRLIPLEVVFRFGMPAGSSLQDRLQANPAYAQQIGLSSVPAAGDWFERPVLEFFTKLEPKDRLLNLTEALAISSLNDAQFRRLTEIAQLCALALFDIFAEKGIQLWDGKFEFILDNDEIKIADSIGPDELRLIYNKLHFSKEIIRQVYRGGAWEQSLKQAQKLATQRQAHDWKTICRDELNSFPAPLPVPFKKAMDKMYPTLVNHLTGEKLFANQPGLDELVSLLTAAAN